jgi:hypothetical protein
MGTAHVVDTGFSHVYIYLCCETKSLGISLYTPEHQLSFNRPISLSAMYSSLHMSTVETMKSAH